MEQARILEEQLKPLERRSVFGLLGEGMADAISERSSSPWVVNSVQRMSSFSDIKGFPQPFLEMAPDELDGGAADQVSRAPMTSFGKCGHRFTGARTLPD